MAFLDEDYLLTSDMAKSLFQRISTLPIADLHSHVEAGEIAENKGWQDLWEVEAATDHYLWELMRRCGVSEEKITGSAPNKEKWLALAVVFPRFGGNPVYDWIHLDLKRRFGIQEPLGPETGEQIWQATKAQLATERMKPQQLLEEMNVEILCTTESPLSDLKWHKELRKNFSKVQVLPTWRPDEVLQIGSQKWRKFVDNIGDKTKNDISQVSGLIDALAETHHYFAEHNCVTSDHGVEQPWAYFVSKKTAARIYAKAYRGQTVNDAERRDFQAFMLHLFGELAAEAGWVMQLHIGAVRDYRASLLNSLGRDSGGDVTSHNIELILSLYDFLNEFDSRLQIVLYGLHPSHIYTLATLVRAFPNLSIGAPWWFMDNPYHMREHLFQVANIDLLANHAGMVTDSRKLFSYESRTEMFRRVLSDFLGEMIEQGRIPFPVGEEIAMQIAYYHPKDLFFSEKERTSDV